MTRRYSNLDELIHDLDENSSLADDPFVGGVLDDDDLAILGQMNPDTPRASRTPAKKPAKRGRPVKKKTP